MFLQCGRKSPDKLQMLPGIDADAARVNSSCWLVREARAVKLGALREKLGLGLGQSLQARSKRVAARLA